MKNHISWYFYFLYEKNYIIHNLCDFVDILEVHEDMHDDQILFYFVLCRLNKIINQALFNAINMKVYHEEFHGSDLPSNNFCKNSIDKIWCC